MTILLKFEAGGSPKDPPVFFKMTGAAGCCAPPPPSAQWRRGLQPADLRTA